MTTEFKSFREESRIDYGRHMQPDDKMTRDDLQFGALLRIADASEQMAKNIVRLQRERDEYEAMYKRSVESNIKTARSNAALRGVIKKMKRGTP